MILAGPIDYLFAWQLPIVLAFLLAWLVGGPYLTRRALTKAGLPRSKTRLGRCAQINFLANLAAIAAAGMVGLLFVVLAVRVGPRNPWVLAGLVLGLLTGVAMSWTAHWVMLELPARELRRVLVASVGPLALVGAVLLGGAGFPAWIIRQREAEFAQCTARLVRIETAVERYTANHPGKLAPSLDALLSEELLTEADLCCPARGEGTRGYLYAPAPDANHKELKERIRACDRRGNHADKRLVLYNDGSPGIVTEDRFQELLGKDVNAAIANADKADQ